MKLAPLVETIEFSEALNVTNEPPNFISILIRKQPKNNVILSPP